MSVVSIIDVGSSLLLPSSSSAGPFRLPPPSTSQGPDVMACYPSQTRCPTSVSKTLIPFFSCPLSLSSSSPVLPLTQHVRILPRSSHVSAISQPHPCSSRPPCLTIGISISSPTPTREPLLEFSAHFPRASSALFPFRAKPRQCFLRHIFPESCPGPIARSESTRATCLTARSHASYCDQGASIVASATSSVSSSPSSRTYKGIRRRAPLLSRTWHLGTIECGTVALDSRSLQRRSWLIGKARRPFTSTSKLNESDGGSHPSRISSCSEQSSVARNAEENSQNNASVEHAEEGATGMRTGATPQGRRAVIRSLVKSTALLALSKIIIVDGLIDVPEKAAAFSLGTSGPKDWLTEQKRKSAKFLLDPIQVSRVKLDKVLSVFDPESNVNGDAVESARDAYARAQTLVRSASRDCLPLASGSLIELQSRAIEVCTFRLILKNAASLLDEDDSKKVKANVALSELVASFTSLEKAILHGASLAEGDYLLDGVAADWVGAREAVLSATRQTQDALDRFSTRIKIVLDV